MAIAIVLVFMLLRSSVCDSWNESAGEHYVQNKLEYILN
jgi:hypothetical protein